MSAETRGPDGDVARPGGHHWDICAMCGPMVRCGYCGNNCCNGGSGKVGTGEKCPDNCTEAYVLQATNNPPHELLERWHQMPRGRRLVSVLPHDAKTSGASEK